MRNTFGTATVPGSGKRPVCAWVRMPVAHSKGEGQVPAQPGQVRRSRPASSMSARALAGSTLGAVAMRCRCRVCSGGSYAPCRGQNPLGALPAATGGFCRIRGLAGAVLTGVSLGAAMNEAVGAWVRRGFWFGDGDQVVQLEPVVEVIGQVFALACPDDLD